MLNSLVLYNGGMTPNPKQLFQLESSKSLLNVCLIYPVVNINTTRVRTQHAATDTVGTQLTSLSLSIEGHLSLRFIRSTTCHRVTALRLHQHMKGGHFSGLSVFTIGQSRVKGSLLDFFKGNVVLEKTCRINFGAFAILLFVSSYLLEETIFYLQPVRVGLLKSQVLQASSPH